mmetsp:Transcript_26120/g.52959  ORF Transcript_26120/g.52959 Transcript_26120/m.52959 type:complete len:219 (+) Transcript_26120:1137-1793(+)
MLAEYRYKLIDLVLLLLKDAFGDPDKVTNFLLLELDVGVKYGKVHLSLKGKLELLDVTLVECIINRLVSTATLMNVPYGGILGEQLKDTAQLVLVGNVGEHGGTGGVEVADGGVQPLAVGGTHGGLIEGSTEGVEGDVDGVGIGTDLEEVAHDCLGLTPELVNELGKILNPVLDEGGFDDFNLNLLEDVARITKAVGRFLKELRKVRSDGSIDEDSLV